MSAKDYDDDSYDIVAFNFDPLANKFIEEELVQLKTKLDETTKRIRDKLLSKKNPSEYRVGSTKSGDEISIVQPEVDQLCASLCELYDHHFNEKLKVRAELKYADINVDIPDPPVSSSSSSAPILTKRTIRSGRIDFTFHNCEQFVMQALGLLECKNTLIKEFHANGNLTMEAKKALAQAFVQLKSQLNKLSDKAIRPLLYVSLLTTGKKWIVLQRELYEGVEIFTHSYECLLLDEDDQFVENYEENLKEVTDMLFYLLFSISVVNKKMKSQKKKFQHVRKYCCSRFKNY